MAAYQAVNLKARVRFPRPPKEKEVNYMSRIETENLIVLKPDDVLPPGSGQTGKSGQETMVERPTKFLPIKDPNRKIVDWERRPTEDFK